MVDMALRRELVACATEQVWAEYRDVLLRDKFIGVRTRAEWLLSALGEAAEQVTAGERATAATDEDDNRFLECASASGALFLITGNLRHYPGEYAGTRVVNARAFLESGQHGHIQRR